MDGGYSIFTLIYMFIVQILGFLLLQAHCLLKAPDKVRSSFPFIRAFWTCWTCICRGSQLSYKARHG